ncbi:Oligopeptide transport ATP-binding protein OppD [Bacillus sp. THAF10]|uniref:ATP-binding cassette domain-containing protein n=1 Tax=Bacillus sp. THAF10 TaxID=2587848 RepID=UPI0012694A8C|nr:ABC transporter ATP-binding protein [Bacillus sp. THAF10]QFT89575.1 Oligopeptide transport ATP-binding protein OppD [Bacillus sp. THAF10]
MSEALLTIKDLHVKSHREGRELLQGVNMEIAQGEMVGLIGESGSGKSLISKTIMGLLPKKMTGSGKLTYKQSSLNSPSSSKKRNILGKEIGIIFQDYRGSFTPYIQIGSQMVETIRTHFPLSKKEAKRLALDALHEMGLDAERVFKSYPFELSGGQVQRAAIATAIVLKPSLLICDEITTALDVLNGEKVLNYLTKMKEETGCAVLLITHDLTQAYKRTDRIYVMEKGQIVEEGLSEAIRCNHQHPYTKKLCGCLLSLPHEKELVMVP